MTGRTAVAEDGEEGDDFVVGSEDADVVLGGAGQDLLVGKGGDDHMRGDATTGYASIDWSVTRKVEEQDDVTYYKTEFTAEGYIQTSAGGDDILLGGGGDDWLMGEGGDDFIDGGVDKDVAFGGKRIKPISANESVWRMAA